jgi:membrane associated rhomboid family serine protease/Flp pilus assembly protein TadD
MSRCVQCGRSMPGFSFGRKTCQWCVEYEATKRGEISEDAVQKVMPVPWKHGFGNRPVTQVIFGINVAVFQGMALAGVSITDPTSQDLLHWGANYGQWTLAGDWWRLVTCVFLHIGVLHIALNMWCLWSLGTLCESLYGSWTFAVVYLICGVSGSLASIAWHPYGISAGASGAIFGIAGALIASIKFGEFSLPRSLVASQLSCLVAFLVYSLIFGAISGTTDNAAHIGGLVAGCVMGVLIARAAPQRDAFLGRVVVIVLAGALVAGAGVWLEHSRGYDARVSRANQLLAQNQGPQAIAELQKLVRRDPSFVPAHFALAHAYFNAGQYSQAENELKRVLQIQPENPDASYRLGMTYLNEKRTAQAKNVFAERLAKNSKDSDAHYGLGLALAAEENHEAAIREFTAVTQLSTDASWAYYSTGNSYLKLNKYDEAIAAFLQGKQIADDHYIEDGLANAYQAKGMKAEAAEAQKKSAQLLKSEADDD